MNTIDKFSAMQTEAFELFKRKNADYGDSFREDGVLGVMIRMRDKLNRFINLARKEGEGALVNEPLRETLLDFHNYSGMGVICLDERTPIEDGRTQHITINIPAAIRKVADELVIPAIRDAAYRGFKVFDDSPAKITEEPEEPTL